ncbi:sigma-70 family RNA polymerase sigma factor [candidate division KSB1 bacterium]|nr:sigma-70 family RNA polymerase sigma factor [candidate division KSB1 bacterium]
MKDKEQKYKKIILDHYDMIFRLCCSYVRDAEVRKDLLQNIMIRIWKVLNSFENRSSISTWIYRLSVNTSLDFLRKENKGKNGKNHIDINEISIIDESKNVEENLIISEKIHMMYKCINTLTFVDQTIITLYLEDLSYREISEIVGISEKYVGVKLVRIKKKLNRCLKDHYYECQ